MPSFTSTTHERPTVDDAEADEDALEATICDSRDISSSTEVTIPKCDADSAEAPIRINATLAAKRWGPREEGRQPTALAMSAGCTVTFTADDDNDDEDEADDDDDEETEDEAEAVCCFM